MTQWLTAFDALPEDRSSVPNTSIRQLPTKCKASSRKPIASLPSLCTALNCVHLCVCVCVCAHTHTHTQISTQLNNKENLDKTFTDVKCPGKQFWCIHARGVQCMCVCCLWRTKESINPTPLIWNWSCYGCEQVLGIKPGSSARKTRTFIDPSLLSWRTCWFLYVYLDFLL